MDLKEAEDIKKRWQEFTEELHKKELHDPDNHDGVVTYLEPDILECEVTWALGSGPPTYTGKVMFKFLQARLQQYVNCELVCKVSEIVRLFEHSLALLFFGTITKTDPF